MDNRNHPVFRQPENLDVPIWRYMDLAKYLALIQSRSLFFPRATRLGDPFEGSLPRGNTAAWNSIRETRRTDPRFKDTFSIMDDKMFDSLRTNMSTFRKEHVSKFFVSCWHMNERESAAMWKLYSESHFAVAVRSTYQRLYDTLPKWIFIGMVNYIDYEISHLDEGQILLPIVHKRVSFEHEREVRAVAWEMQANELPELKMWARDSGLLLPIDPEILIDAVHISPFAPAWFAEVVTAATTAVIPKLKVIQSSLAGEPLF